MYPKLLFHLSQVDVQNLGNALLLHGNAVEHIGLLHGAAPVGNDDKLGLIAKVAKVGGKLPYIDVVQRRVNFVLSQPQNFLPPYPQDCKV